MAYFELKEFPGLKIPWHRRPPISIWIKLKQFVYQRDKGLCHYCGTPTRYENSHCHHTLELSEGGTNHPSNLKTLCVKCHKIRHPFMKSPIEKLKEQGDQNVHS